MPHSVLTGQGDIEREIEQALAELAEPKARPEFKASLHEQFIHGDFESVEEELEDEFVPRPAAASQRRLWGVVALVAASIALFVTLFPWDGTATPDEDGAPVIVDADPTAAGTSDPEGDPLGDPSGDPVADPAPPVDPIPAPEVAVWTVVGDVGNVLVDGVELTSASAVDDALAAAERVEVMQGDLRLRLGDAVLVEATPTTAFAFNDASASSGDPAATSAKDRLLALTVDSGVLRVCTGPDFPGSTMGLTTPDIELGVTGTAFALDIYPQGTCVCCIEGTVDVKPLDLEQRHDVSADGMLFAHRDRAKPCFLGDVRHEHTSPLHTLEEFAKTLW